MARTGRDIFQGEAEDFIGYLAGGKAHDPLNAGSSHMICIIIGQRSGFDFVDYPEKKQMYRYASQPADPANIAAVSHPH